MKLKTELIKLNANPTDKTEAIKVIAQLFVDADCTTAEYLSGMLAREEQENTYLGKGVAIPHGTPEVRDQIKETSIAVMQIPQGLEWGEDGEPVHLAIGIAANSDEHLQILGKLVRILNNQEQLDTLINTDDASVIQAALSDEED
ncbi:MAG: hypothetical protein CSA10_01480 [Cardiobacteriales bacterium]|nr:MAG: hypothetical protein CSA10_01480 [Cardiobacteriales bacterium]